MDRRGAFLFGFGNGHIGSFYGRASIDHAKRYFRYLCCQTTFKSKRDAGFTIIVSFNK